MMFIMLISGQGLIVPDFGFQKVEAMHILWRDSSEGTYRRRWYLSAHAYDC